MEQEKEPEIQRAKRLINKLLERTMERGCSEHEALEASEKVTDLLKQFDLTLEEVVIRAETCVKREVYAPNDCFGSLVSGIAKLCSLVHYLDTGKTGYVYVMFGFQRDMELAIFLYETLLEAFDYEWALFTKENGFARKVKESFQEGFADRVWHRLYDLRVQRDEANAARVKASGCKDLVLVRDALVKEEFSKTGVRLSFHNKQRTRDSNAYSHGQAAGSRASINVPLNGDKRSLLG